MGYSSLIKGSVASALKDVSYDSTNDAQKVTLTTALSSAFDSVNVNKMSAGGIVTAHSAITATATSAEIDCRGYKNVRIEVEVTAFASGTNTPSIVGSEISGGSFGSIFRDVAGTMTAYTLPALNAVGKVIYIVKDVPNFIKITETISGTLTTTVKVTPFN